jgi:hypothetical protein
MPPELPDSVPVPQSRKVEKKQRFRQKDITPADLKKSLSKSKGAANAAPWWKLVDIHTELVNDDDGEGNPICYDVTTVKCKLCNASHGNTSGMFNAFNWASTHFRDHSSEKKVQCKAAAATGMHRGVLLGSRLCACRLLAC